MERVPAAWRSEFPALRQLYNGKPIVFFDGPEGTQTPRIVAEAMERYLIETNSNIHGFAATGQATDETIAEARRAAADFVGAHSPETISFGPNTTTLIFNLSRALGRDLKPGDRVIVTEIEHEANISPWRYLAESGAEIVSVPLRGGSIPDREAQLDYDVFMDLLQPPTKIVSLAYASNVFGTVNDVERVVRRVREIGATAVVDAVHWAPHGAIDVGSIDPDFLFCSAYKFFGPHLAFMYAKPEAAERVVPYKVAPAPNEAPFKFETGSQNHEGLAGLRSAIDFIASRSTLPSGSARRQRILDSLHDVYDYEHHLLARTQARLGAIPGVTIYGPPIDERLRAPTLSFTVKGRDPQDIGKDLGTRNVAVYAGDLYATPAARRFSLDQTGGWVRIGLAPYTTLDEVEYGLEVLEEVVAARSPSTVR